MGGNKRRMPDAPTPEMLKRLKPETPAAPAEPMDVDVTNGVPSNKGKSRATTVRDEEDEDEEARHFAPGNDADYFAEEDGEGRFFGGGLTSEQKTILSIFESAAEEGTQEDVSGYIGGPASLTLLRVDVNSLKNYLSPASVECFYGSNEL